MEEKSSAVVSESLVNAESKTQASLVVEEAVVVVAKEPGLGGGDDGAGTVMVGSGEGSTGPMGLEVAVKKRRGRPRKYEVDGDMVGPVSLPPGILSSMSESPSKRSRGRPRGSGKLQLMASLGGFAADTAGASFTPHVVTVNTSEDIVSKISSISQRGPRAVCILSATGVVSCVTIRQPGSSGGILRYEGRFEILSLSGSYTFVETGGIHDKNGMLSVSLAKPDGRVFGGGVAGALIAAGPIQLIVGSFKQNLNKKIKKRHSAESSTAASIPCPSDLVRVPIHLAKMNDGDDSCTTPTSSLLDPIRGGAVDILALRQNMNPSSLHSVGQLASQPLLPMPDQRTSPDVNASIP
ncbi:AT-hook motif nuclear-localized protein 9-like [Fagus crenata]